MKLSENTYRVRFQGNGFSSSKRADDFLLRRCAEITLENGRRYFELVATEEQDREDPLMPEPERVATIRLLPDSSPAAIDAALVVRQTDAQAGRKLSREAREAVERFAANP